MDVKLRLLIEAVDNASRQLKYVSDQLQGVATSARETKAAGKGLGAEGERGLNRMAQAAEKLQERLDAARKTAQALTKVGLQLSAAGATLIGAIALPVKTAASFERAMSRVVAVTAGARESFEALRKTAAELGRTTRFTAVEAAEGMKFLGQAGFTAKQVIEAIRPSLDLAAAGELDLAEAADLASNVVQAFNLRVSDLAHAADVLANTATSSNTSVRQLGEAFKFAAPAAAAAGVSLEDAAAAMGVLGNAGIQASLAGTTLRGILASLSKPTKEAQEALDRLHVQIAKDAKGNVDLITTLRRLRNAHMSLADAVTIFRRQGAAGALVLAKYVDQVGKLSEANRKADGSARRMATTIEENLIGAFIRLKSAVEGLLEVLGRPLLKRLTQLVDKVTEFTTALAQAAESHQTLVGVVGSLVGGLGGLAVAFGAVFTAVGLVLKVFISLGRAWASALAALPKIVNWFRELRGVLNSSAIAASALSRAFLALNAAISALEIIRAVKAFLGMRKAMNEAADATNRLIASSRRLQAKFSEFKDFEIPEDFASLSPDKLEELKSRLRKARAYYIATMNVLEERTKKRKFFGFGGLTEDAKEAKRQLEVVKKKLKEINDFFRALPAARERHMKEETNRLRKQVEEQAKADAERKKREEERRKADIEATAAAEAIKIAIMEESIKKIELEKQRALDKARKRFAKASPETLAKLEVAIVEKYEKKKANLRERVARESYERRRRYSELELDLLRQQTDAYLAELRRQLEEGGITEEEFFNEKRERITSFYQKQMDMIKEQIKNAVDQGSVPELEIKLKLKKEEMEDALRGLAAEEQQYHADRVAMERNADMEILRARMELLGPDQMEEAADIELEMIRLQNEQKLEEFRKLTNDKIKIHEMELLLQQQYTQKQIELEREAAAKRLAIQQQSAGLIEGIFGDLYEATGRKVKAFFYLQKAAAVAEAIIQANLAANKAMSQLGVYGPPMAALIYAQAMARVAMIAAQTIRGFAEGGLVRGRKGRDQILARLTDQEYVMRPEAVKAYGIQFMEAINRRLLKIESLSLPNIRITTPRTPAYATGGVVSPKVGDLPSGERGGSSVNIVNVVDPGLLDEYLASSEGQNAILNVLSQRALAVRRILQ